ncbi:hypothetical protein WICMUC_004159 [Wickerhamomyces mucosus]|uniref:UDENN FLCN/SMCR8-type domain-containing protein n=1 Tax=Wickerhamomyces mucosus TaxID=1378264 RepID=A0A9P8TAU0_9ASCO|nr:hypothetical protein WICMUC_004159 [Wickerhamomyces mucosus]
MDFTITLSHFCDIHGPRSILCTSKIPLNNDFKTDFIQEEIISKEDYCKSCLLIISTNNNNDNDTVKPSTIKTIDQNYIYFTNQYSISKYQILNSLIKKTLSEEITNYNSNDPVYLGDEIRGYSMVYYFKIKDLEARGSNRRYSIIINSSNEFKILQNYKLIDQYIKTLISNLKESNIKYELNKSKNYSNNDLFLRGKKIQNSNSLIELLNDKDIFIRIHLWFVKILQKI